MRVVRVTTTKSGPVFRWRYALVVSSWDSNAHPKDAGHGSNAAPLELTR